jgi:hypothetical protein
VGSAMQRVKTIPCWRKVYIFGQGLSRQLSNCFGVRFIVKKKTLLATQSKEKTTNQQADLFYLFYFSESFKCSKQINNITDIQKEKEKNFTGQLKSYKMYLIIHWACHRSN